MLVQSEFRYRGRNFSEADVESVRQAMAAHPGLSRRRLSAKLCQAWNWVQANGQPRDMVARSLMLARHRAGRIQLPAQRMSPPNNAARHRVPASELPLQRTRSQRKSKGYFWGYFSGCTAQFVGELVMQAA